LALAVSGDVSLLRRFAIEWLQLVYFMAAFAVWASRFCMGRGELVSMDDVTGLAAALGSGDVTVTFELPVPCLQSTRPSAPVRADGLDGKKEKSRSGSTHPLRRGRGLVEQALGRFGVELSRRLEARVELPPR
jgi:hypothetical protein